MNAKSEARTVSFMVFSCLTHIALATVVLTLDMEPKIKPETVQIEIMGPSEHLNIQPEPLVAVQAPKISQDIQPEKQPDIQPQVEKIEVAQELPKKAPAKSVATKPILAKTLPLARKMTAPVTRQETPVQQESPVVLPVVVNENLQEAPPEPHSELKDTDIASDFDQVDQQQADPQENAKIAALNADIQKEADAEMKDQEEKLVAMQKQNQIEAQALAKENAQKRAQERAALAEAQARQQAEIASSQAQKLAGANAGIGQSPQGEPVRSVEDLKQVPGNQKPQYDKDDRLQGRQGEVAFLAYVTKDGLLSQFKLLKSTGHRELDGKTLKAIKNWKFFPGQEGWVEIPYNWTLKGGAQPIGPILRTKRSASTYDHAQPTSSRN